MYAVESVRTAPVMDRGMEKGGIVIEKVPSPCMEEAEQARAIVKEKRSFSEQVFPERGCGFPFRIT